MHMLDPLHTQMGVEEGDGGSASLCSTTLPCSRRQSEKLENFLGKAIFIQDVSYDLYSMQSDLKAVSSISLPRLDF